MGRRGRFQTDWELSSRSRSCCLGGGGLFDESRRAVTWGCSVELRATTLLAFLIAACGGGASAFAAEGDQKTSCWRGEALTLCFDGRGTVTSSTFMFNDHDSSVGFQTRAKYWGTGGVIHFEVPDPRTIYVGWPWEWSRVSCALGGPPDVMALNECTGSGQSTRDGAPAAQRDLTLCLVPIKDSAPCK